jgi:hypothetical protein
MVLLSNHLLNDSRSMSVAYLEKLNSEQRRAVGGAPPAVCRDDTRQGRFAFHRPAALLSRIARTPDRHVYAARTRFIPDGLLNLFNKTAWPVIAAGSAGVRGPSQGVRVDAGARMRGMWR